MAEITKEMYSEVVSRVHKSYGHDALALNTLIDMCDDLAMPTRKNLLLLYRKCIYMERVYNWTWVWERPRQLNILLRDAGIYVVLYRCQPLYGGLGMDLFQPGFFRIDLFNRSRDCVGQVRCSIIPGPLNVFPEWYIHYAPLAFRTLLPADFAHTSWFGLIVEEVTSFFDVLLASKAMKSKPVLPAAFYGKKFRLYES